MKYTAIYTERPGPKLVADILVVFAHRDEQVKDDVEGTCANLDAEGMFPHLRDFDRLADVPEELDLTLDPATPPTPSTLNAQRSTQDLPSTVGLGSTAPNTFGAVPPGNLPGGTGEAPPAHAPAKSDELSDVQMQAIHSCLRLLAGQCDGARRLDGAGFNKMDAQFGHSLANAPHLSQKQARAGHKLVSKYHRQLPVDLLALALGDQPNSSDSSEKTAPPADSALCTPHSALATTPAQLVNAKYMNNYGDTYQNGVKPGPKKLAQFIEVLKLTGTPALYAQDGKGDEATVYVKLFDPAGSWTWYITEFSETAPDGCKNLAYNLVTGSGIETEMGYADLAELSEYRGSMGIGIEIDMHFKPQTLAACRSAVDARAN